MRLTKQDKELIEIATQVAKSNSDIYDIPSMHVGCALRAKSGKIYKGINLKTSHSVCAEQVAIGQALAWGEREIETIVAAKMENGKPCVVSPCGLCRYIMDKLKLNCNVIVKDKNSIIKVKASELLPYPY